MTELTVTTLMTRALAAENLSDQDYRDIYTELRAKGSLDAFVKAVRSRYSKAWWCQYERGDFELTRAARQELRAAVGLPTLPLTVAEATAQVDADATVYQVGAAPSDRVILVSAALQMPLNLHVNSTLIANEDQVYKALVTPLTRPRTRAKRKAIHLYPETYERLAGLRREA